MHIYAHLRTSTHIYAHLIQVRWVGGWCWEVFFAFKAPNSLHSLSSVNSLHSLHSLSSVNSLHCFHGVQKLKKIKKPPNTLSRSASKQ